MISRRLMRQPNPGPQHILEVSGTVGAYWSADPSRFFTDTAATIPAIEGGELGAFVSLDPAIKAVATTKPFLRRTPQTKNFWVESLTTSVLVATFPAALGSNCTVVRVDERGVVFERGLTIGTTYSVALASNYNSDILVVNRPTTVYEDELLKDYLGRRIPHISSELVFNGHFDTDVDGWSLIDPDVTLSWDNGAAMITRVAGIGGPRVIQTSGFIHQPGNQYVSSVRNVGQTQAAVRIYVGASSGNAITPSLTTLNVGEFRRIVGSGFRNVGAVSFTLGTNSTVLGTVVIGDISFKQIL